MAGIKARLAETRTPMLLRAQGIEVINLFDCVVQSSTLSDLDIRIDDILVPESGRFVGRDFVVKAVQGDALSDNPNDFRRHKFLSLQRVEVARKVQ